MENAPISSARPPRPRRVQSFHQRPASPRSEPMPTQPDPIPLRELADETAPPKRPGQDALYYGHFVHAFCDFCHKAGVTHLPDERLAELAGAYLDITTVSGSPSPNVRRTRRRAVRALLKTALRRGVIIPDPFATTCDRVVAGEDVPLSVLLASYIPNGLDQAAWERVRPDFLTMAAQALEGDAGIERRSLCGFLSRLLVWCDQQSIPLEPSAILDTGVIDRHLRWRFSEGTGSYTAGRSVLTRAGFALLPRVVHRPVRRSHAKPPYTADEKGDLVGWVQTLTGRCRHLWVPVVLGLGGGFDVTDFRFLRGTHFTRRNGLVVVHDPSERQYPVVIEPEWEDDAFRLAEEAGENYVYQPNCRARMNRGFVSALLWAAGAPPAGTPNLDCRRLRTTWLVNHLQRGTDVNVLMRAAGLTSLGTLDRYLEFLSCPPEEEFLRILRGDR